MPLLPLPFQSLLHESGLPVFFSAHTVFVKCYLCSCCCLVYLKSAPFVIASLQLSGVIPSIAALSVTDAISLFLASIANFLIAFCSCAISSNQAYQLNVIIVSSSSSFISFCFISERNLSISCSVSIEYVLAPATLLMETFLRLFVFTFVGAGVGLIGSLPGTTGATGGSGAG